MASLAKMQAVSDGWRIDRRSSDYKMPHTQRTVRYNPVTQRFESVNSQDGLLKDHVFTPDDSWYGVVKGELVCVIKRPWPKTLEEFKALIREGTLAVSVTPTEVPKAPDKPRPRGDALQCRVCNTELPDPGEMIARRHGFYCSEKCAEEGKPYAEPIPRFCLWPSRVPVY